MLVTCADCRGFIKDTIGNGRGIGRCKVYEHYVNKGATATQLNELVVVLGNKAHYHVFWGGTESRECSKFKRED